MSARADLAAVVGELEGVLRAVDPAAVERLEERLSAAGRVYVAGAGRSGLMVRAFAMRLMHLGLQAHVVGEVTTPALRAGDLLVIGSGSGETSGSCALARKARALGAAVAVVTAAPGSTLAGLADVVVRLDVPSARPAPGERASVQLMGSLFEQSLLLLLDAVAMRLARARGATADELFARHANLE